MELFGGMKTDIGGFHQLETEVFSKESHANGTSVARGLAEIKKLPTCGAHWNTWRVGSGEALHGRVHTEGERESADAHVEETCPGRGPCAPSARVLEDRWGPHGWGARSRRHMEKIELHSLAWLGG